VAPLQQNELSTFTGPVLCRDVRRRLQEDARSVAAAGVLQQGNVLRLSLSDDAEAGYFAGGGAAARGAVMRLTRQLQETHARLAQCQLRCRAQEEELAHLRGG
jgi:hypothetical protein